nr:MAG TPA: hypothetical protein [Caudoviricetes sp.]
MSVVIAASLGSSDIDVHEAVADSGVHVIG